MGNSYFAPCPRGLEELLANELTQAGAQLTRSVAGGVAFEGSETCARRANLNSRIATRVLWLVAEGPYRREDDIYRLAHDVAWPKLFDVHNTIRVFTTAIRSPLRSLDFVTLRVKDAVCDRFRDDLGRRPNVSTQAPDMRIHTFLTAEDASIYLDLSGEPLYKRGFRLAHAGAPLKENLASGIVMLSGWRGAEPFLDPMCGSGTILIEAAQIAMDVAPGLARSFAFEKLKNFDSDAWTTMLEEARARRKPVPSAPLHGAELYGDELTNARRNIAAAGVDSCIALKQGNILELSAPAAKGVMVANPPYGVRMGQRGDLATFYPKLGAALKRRFAGWHCYFLSADTALPKGMGLRPSRRTPLYNGALECRLYEFKMVAGSNRRAGEIAATPPI